MITKSVLMAKPSRRGHNGFEYPNIEGDSIVLHKGSNITELYWVGGGELTPFAWTSEEGVRVVWIKQNRGL